jgi:hypothetical protein
VSWSNADALDEHAAIERRDPDGAASRRLRHLRGRRAGVLMAR